MAWWKKHDYPAPGKPIVARDLRRVAQTADMVSQLRADAPLSVQVGFSGILIRYLGQVFGAYIAVTSGTITARSGTTPGTGNVTPYGWDGTSLVTMGTTIPVYSISSTTGGIPTNTYCIVLKIFGAYWIITADCGN